MARRPQAEENYWPGFVDALSTIVMVITFLLILLSIVIFVLSQNTAKRAVDVAQAKSDAGKVKVDSKSTQQSQAKSKSSAQKQSNSLANKKAQSKSKSERKSQSQAQSKSQAQAKSQSKAQSKSQPQAKSQSKAQSKSQAQAKSQSKAQSKSKAQAKSQSKAQSKSKAQAKSQSKAQSKSQPQAKSQSMAQSKSQAQAKSQSKASSTSQSTQKSQMKAQQEKVSPNSTAGTFKPKEGKPLTQAEKVESKDKLKIRSRAVDDAKRIVIAPEEKPKEQSKIKVVTAKSLLTLEFEKSNVKIDDGSVKSIQSFLTSNADIKGDGKIEIRSYANSKVGSISEARRLAYYRAMATRNQLLRSGVDSKRISIRIRETKAKGELDLVKVFLKPQ